MACAWIKKLKLKRSHILSFIFWQLSQICGAQSLFPVFFNFTPDFRFSDDSDWLTKENCNSSIKFDWSNASFRTPFKSAVQDFLLICGSRAYFAYLISTIQFVGVLLGAFGFGQIADIFGRRSTGLFVLILGAISCAIGGASTSWIMLTICRFFVGTATGGCIVVLFAFVIELIEPQQRIFLRSFFNWGWSRLAVTVVCLVFPNWRVASYIFAALHLPPFLMLLFIFPESPKWLNCKGRKIEAKKAMMRIAKINGEDWDKKQEDKEDEIVIKVTSSNSEKRVYTAKDLFAKEEYIKTITFLCMWFTSAMSTYTIDLNSRNIKGPFFFIQFMFCLLLIISKMFLFVVDEYFPKFNRRMLYQLPACMSVVVLLSVVVVMSTVSQQDSVIPIIIFTLMGSVFMEYTFDACYLCTAEGYPTVIRTIGLGACSGIAARIGAIVAPQIAYLSSYWSPSPFLVMSIINICNLIVSFRFLPDTKGMQLKDNIQDDEITQDANVELQPLKN